MSTNPYERLRRLEKATKLADVLSAAGFVGIRVDELEQCRPSSEVWTAAAAQAGVKPPSVATCAVVCELLRKREEV